MGCCPGSLRLLWMGYFFPFPCGSHILQTSLEGGVIQPGRSPAAPMGQVSKGGALPNLAWGEKVKTPGQPSPAGTPAL